MFFMCGPASSPLPNQRPVGFSHVKDGPSDTLFFGERSHFDPNYDIFAAKGWDQPIGVYGWWHTCGGFAIGDVTLSTYAPINYRMPPAEHGSTLVPPVNSAADFAFYIDLRVSAFGSNHPAGANFTMVDGSARFIADAINLITLRGLSTRRQRTRLRSLSTIRTSRKRGARSPR